MLWPTTTKVSVIKFAGRAKSIACRQKLLLFVVANLSRQVTLVVPLNRILFSSRVCPPPAPSKTFGKGRTSLLLPPGAEDPN